MIKVIVVAYRRSDMTMEEFQRFWREEHAPVAAKIPGLRKYVQNHVRLASQTGIYPKDILPLSSHKETDCDGIVELWFDSAEAAQEGFSQPDGQAARNLWASFTDGDKTTTIIVDEMQIV